MLRLSALLALFVALPCLWDRDTLRAEVDGAPGMLEILVGRFDRFPAEYYDARLALCVARLDRGIDDLGLLDDAAVACDRLGRSEDAIEWMARKREALDSNPGPDPFHEYTYLANLGTFHVHRWLRGGLDRSALADLELAHQLVSRAIALNPDAHFGRERYQRLAIEWLLEPDAPTDEVREPSLLTKAVGQPVGQVYAQALAGAGLDDAAVGLAGLVHLGDAWDSSAIWLALAQALDERGDASLARLAGLRLCEILQAGPEAVPYAGFEPIQFLESRPATLEVERRGALDAWYERARRSVAEWRKAREAFLLERIAAGDHPDQNEGFWAEWRDRPSLPPMPDGPGGQLSLRVGTAIIASAIVLALLLLLRRVLRAG